jgi:hypothetical protein
MLVASQGKLPKACMRPIATLTPSLPRIPCPMRIAIYFTVVVALAGLAWLYPFLFELPLAAAIGGAYWAFFADRSETRDRDGAAERGRRRE